MLQKPSSWQDRWLARYQLHRKRGGHDAGRLPAFFIGRLLHGENRWEM